MASFENWDVRDSVPCEYNTNIPFTVVGTRRAVSEVIMKLYPI